MKNKTQKKSTLKVLCKEKQVDLVEWDQSALNLKSLDFQPDTDAPSDFSQGYESQIKVFTQFLFKSSRYQTNQMFNAPDSTQRKLLYVKEIPNFAFRDTKTFLNLLIEFKRFSKFSLIFSVTQTTTYSSEHNPQKIFSSEARKTLRLTEISFNSLANTYLSRQIERIARIENFNFVDKKFIEGLCATSNGDLRHAINLLEMSSTQPKRVYQDLTNVVKKKARVTQNCFDSGFKDPNYSIFRGLGKVLHRKNSETASNTDEYLPKHLNRFYRPELGTDPDDIYEKLPLSSDLILAYLHQNYADIFNAKSSSADFEQKFAALGHISDSFIMADMINKKSGLFEISGSGNQEARLKEISAVIAIRSVLFNFYFDSNAEKVDRSSSKSLWMPLYKPFNGKLIEAKLKRKKMARDFVLASQTDASMIKYLIEINKEFFTEFVPFVQLKSQFKRTSHSSLMLRPEFCQLFMNYKAVSTRSSQQQTNENDFETLNEDQSEVVEENKQDNSCLMKGSYSYEDPSCLNIVDYNF